MMDEETRTTFRALIAAVTTLSGALWDVHDIRREESQLTHAKAVLASNPASQVQALLALAKDLVDPEESE